MKARIGVDAESSLVQTVTATTTDVGSTTETAVLLQRKEKMVLAETGYADAEKLDWL